MFGIWGFIRKVGGVLWVCPVGGRLTAEARRIFLKLSARRYLSFLLLFLFCHYKFCVLWWFCQVDLYGW